jgi:hypothetical protein
MICIPSAHQAIKENNHFLGQIFSKLHIAKIRIKLDSNLLFFFSEEYELRYLRLMMFKFF